MTSNCAARPLCAAFARARSTSSALPSKPTTCAPARGDRQREVAEAAEEVRDALARLRVEQAHRARHQDAVHGVVHLGEIGRTEVQAQVELGQLIVELARRRTERMRAVRPAGLQPERDAVPLGELLERAFIRGSERLEMRNTSTASSSPTATSICGRRAWIESVSTSARSGGMRSLIRRGRTSHSRMSAT